jgi:HlyD family secretion protein
MKKKWWILIIVAVILVGVGYLYFQGKAAVAKASSAYQTQKLSRGSLISMVGVTGTVRPNQSAVLSWQTSGNIDKINVKVGDTVKADQVLASLLETSLPQSVIMAQSDLVDAQKALDNLEKSSLAKANAQLDLYNAQSDYKDADSSRKALDKDLNYVMLRKVQGSIYVAKQVTGKATTDQIAKADAKLAVAKAKMDDAQREWDRLKDGPDPRDISAAKAKIAAIEATLGTAEMKAPFAGTISTVPVKVGDQVSQGTTAFRVDDLSHLLVDVQVSEVDINRIKVGQPVKMTFDAILNTEYAGKVTEVARVGVSTQGVVNFTVTVEITNPDANVLPQMTAAVNIISTQLDNVLLVPNRAVRVVENERVVYVMKNGIPTATKIVLGATSDTNSELVSGDVKEGDLIVLNPPSTLNLGASSGGGMMR